MASKSKKVHTFQSVIDSLKREATKAEYSQKVTTKCEFAAPANPVAQMTGNSLRPALALSIKRPHLGLEHEISGQRFYSLKLFLTKAIKPVEVP